MNKFKNLHTAFSLKSFVVAPILFLLFALAGHFTIVNAASVRTQKSSYAPGETIVVEFSGLPGNQADWISLARANDPDNKYIHWEYTRGRKSGTMEFRGMSSLSTIGQYEVRVYYNSGIEDFIVRARNRFKIQSNEGGNGGCGLGVSWDESESGWNGKWTRRGNSNVFDAYWQKSGWTPINQILTVTVSGSYVSIHRQDPNISNNTCSYTGTIGADGVTVSGQYSCNNRGTIYGPATWSAKINCGSNVSSAEITKMRQWIAHYDNLIVQWTQYRDQKVTPYYNHPTYYQWARAEYQKANQAISTSQHYKAHYQKLLRQAGAQ